MRIHQVTRDPMSRLDLAQHRALGRLALVQSGGPRPCSSDSADGSGSPRAAARGSEASPGCPTSGTIGPVRGGNELISPAVYGWSGRSEEDVRGRRLDDLAGVHDRDAIAELDEQRQVVRDEQHGEAETLLERLELLQDLALHDDVERGRRLVHHDQLGLERERHRDHDALPHAARELVRVRADAPAVDADELEQVAGAAKRLRAADPVVRPVHVDELVADAHHRVQHVHRALEDQRHVPPADLAQLLLAHRRRGRRRGT